MPLKVDGLTLWRCPAGVFFYACGYGLSGLAVSFQQFLQRSAVGCDKFLFQFTALDLDGDMIVVCADEGAAGIVKVRVGVAGLLDLAAVDAKLLPELMDHAIL